MILNADEWIQMKRKSILDNLYYLSEHFPILQGTVTKLE